MNRLKLFIYSLAASRLLAANEYMKSSKAIISDQLHFALYRAILGTVASLGGSDGGRRLRSSSLKGGRASKRLSATATSAPPAISAQPMGDGMTRLKNARRGGTTNVTASTPSEPATAPKTDLVRWPSERPASSV